MTGKITKRIKLAAIRAAAERVTLWKLNFGPQHRIRDSKFSCHALSYETRELLYPGELLHGFFTADDFVEQYANFIGVDPDYSGFNDSEIWIWNTFEQQLTRSLALLMFGEFIRTNDGESTRRELLAVLSTNGWTR